MPACFQPENCEYPVDAWLNRARLVIRMETSAVNALETLLNEEFIRAVTLIFECSGRVITTGMGKAGHIAKKVAATFASTGTSSFFVHPAEAVHGDLGMITAQDLVIAFSYKGQTEEVLRILPYLHYHKIPLIAVTSDANSELARHSAVALILPVAKEACPLNLAPTASTTAMLALGDTLAMTLLEARGFKSEDYARFHPGGSLGRRLLTRVEDLMHTGDQNPVVMESSPIREVILLMTSTKLACAAVVNEDGILTGFFSDGDLRRLLISGNVDMERPIRECMTRNPKYVQPGVMAVRALEILREYKIIELPVCDEAMRPVGLIHLHDIMRAGIA